MESPEDAAAARCSSGSDGGHPAATFTKRKRTKRSRAAGTTAEEEDTAQCLILLARGPSREREDEEVGKFECRTCSKCFSSFQALGGHRASHRKPRPAADRADDRIGTGTILDQSAARVHECTICGAEFASGQALGGHMRRHRPVGPTAAAPANAEETKGVLVLDLNLPAPAEDPMAAAFAFADRRPMVGCHY